MSEPELLSCGHPLECAGVGVGVFCGWCLDVERATAAERER